MAKVTRGFLAIVVALSLAPLPAALRGESARDQNHRKGPSLIVDRCVGDDLED